MNSNKSIFEKIIDDEIPGFKIYENEKFLVILDAFPKEYGHTLIIPKLKKENILFENDDLIYELFILGKKISNHLKLNLKSSGIKWLVNSGKSAGQEVEHTHLHLIPYYDGFKKNKKPNERLRKKLFLSK